MKLRYLPLSFLLLMTMAINGQNAPVTPAEIQQTLESALFPFHEEGETTDHYHIHAPNDAELLEVKIDKGDLEVYFHFEEPIDDYIYDGLIETLVPALKEYDLKDVLIFQVLPNGEIIDWNKIFSTKTIISPDPITNDDPAEAIQGDKNQEDPNYKFINPHLGQPVGSGALSGKTVWLSPGHGWLWNNTSGVYKTQRGNTQGMVEDFGSIENINQYIQQYLMNAGANVWSVRERDMNTNEVIVDNDDGAPTYTETGAWSTSSSTGYNGGTYRFAYHTATTTAEAIYTPDIPKEGWYWVSTYYRSGSNRPVDTRYKVTHAGGETIVSINQEVHGLTWVYLGQFYFDAGTNGSVTLINESSDAGSQAIIADAVRFGGGKGDVNDCAYPSSPPSNRDRYDECARQYARFQGYSTCESDVTTRPNYAEWELAKGTTTEQNNAVYISLHTNAFNASARGTETYMYNGTATPNSQLLRNLIQAELANDILADWDPNWNDRGTNSANFGELRELSTMPGALIELAFHDEFNDAQALKTPYFRNLSARAIYKAVVNFFNQVNGTPTDFLPEPPSHLYAMNSATGEITLTWDPPQSGGILGDAATGYNVYLSTHGYGFEDAIPVTGTSHTFTNLNPNTTYYFQVTGTNAGGESFPTATVAARTPLGCDYVPMLIVDGFDRLDRSSNVKQYESSALGTVERTFLDRMNAYDYMVPHARSIGSCNVPFDGASNEAVIAGSVNLMAYEGIDWITGEESTVDNTLDATERSLVEAFLNGGGKLIISGAEIGWDLGRSTSPNADLSFYNNYLKANYVGDDGGSYDFSGSGIYGGITGTFDDGSNCEFNAEYPDRLFPFGGASTVLNYSGGSGDGAAIAYYGADFGVVHFGFPLETITSATVRNDLLCEALDFLQIIAPTYYAACTDPTACNYDANAFCDDGSCQLPDGCMNVAACNYDPTAVCDDGNCQLPDGCTDVTACNYVPTALCDDGSCQLPDGCTNTTACNYDPTALCDDNSCILPDGCTDITACNYVANAVCNNNSCVYPPSANFTILNGNYCTSDSPITLVPTTSGGTFSGPGVTGNIFNPAAAPIGSTITIQYNIGTGGCTNSLSQQTVVNACSNPGLNVAVKVLLEGAYDASTSAMRTNLLQQNVLPTDQPYNVAPWNYTGLESVGNIDNFPPNTVDWVLVELRTGTPSQTGIKTTNLVETVAGLLLDNGDIVGVDGVSPLVFNQLSIAVDYHVLVRHRNHLDVISSTSIAGANNMTYDFRTSMNQAFGASQQRPVGSQFGMYAGDYVVDGVIQVSDFSAWTLNAAYLFTYTLEDGNLDASTQTTDYDCWYPNRSVLGVIEVALP